jgi:hypothetical protein
VHGGTEVSFDFAEKRESEREEEREGEREREREREEGKSVKYENSYSTDIDGSCN